MSSISFRASARTIDHLGKGQIADAPTAISELWKNSYDAYARDVALHLFDGDIKCGSIIDNGCGMTFNQLSSNWLTIGTASKSKKKLLPPGDRFGLTNRATQGEKGIGRLSTAFLAPITLIVTKKIGTGYSAALIDWRLFENTYLGLHDIKVPLGQFDDLAMLPKICSELQKEMMHNLALQPSSDNEKFIRTAWESFTEDEKNAFEIHHNLKSNEKFISTEDQILDFINTFKFSPIFIESWKPMLDKVYELDGEAHGTALFILDLGRDLALLTNRGDMNRESDEYQSIQRDLVDTLRAFVDPFSREDITQANEFNYSIVSVDKYGWLLGDKKVILDYSDIFSYNDFNKLEHKVIGHIDDKGWFRGSVTSFGIEHTDVIIPCRSAGMGAFTKSGEFYIKLGTFEQELLKTTHTESEFYFFLNQAKKYSGLMIFRDNLRVLPYGRLDNDFFEIEESRTRHAGRAYWSSRRLFGEISLNQERNQLLKDKSGREGFIRNQAARELKSLVKMLLQELANRYFGDKSDIRQEFKIVWDKEKQKRKKAQSSSAKVIKQIFVAAMDNNLPKLNIQVDTARKLHQELASDFSLSLRNLDALVAKIDRLEALRPELKAPIKPAKMGESLEEKYRCYRDLFAELSELLVTCREKLNKLETQAQCMAPIASAEKKFKNGDTALTKLVNHYASSIDKNLKMLNALWQREITLDRSAYEKRALVILDEVSDSSDTVQVLNNLDSIHRELEDDFIYKYEAILQALDKLQQGVDIDSAFSIAEEERVQAEQEINQIRGLAQLGISFEILAHELHAQDQAVTRALNSMSSDAKQELGFQNALRSHKQFTEYLRFLSPLKLSGYQTRDEITGQEIIKYINVFFRDQFLNQNINLEISDRFKRMVIVDVKSRIMPVFINLLNNALYWVTLADKRHIIVDVIDGLVIIANNGPAIDQDDIDKLFNLFYSRKPNGNGVGLYLSKQNLSVARHKIWYAEKPEEKLIKNGANFVIKFQGMEII